MGIIRVTTLLSCYKDYKDSICKKDGIYKCLVEHMGVIILSTIHVFSSKLNFATTVRYPHLGDILKSIPAGF